MRLYADRPARLARQVVGDALLVGIVFLAVRGGIAVYEMVERLAAFGRAGETAGVEVARNTRRAEAAIGGVPFVGDLLRDPLVALRETGVALAEAGRTQQAFVADLAASLGVFVAILPIVVAVALWLPRRVRWVREANAAAELVTAPGGVELLASRALATLPLRRLAAAHDDPAVLAALKLAELGVVPRHGPSSPATVGGASQV